MIGYASRHLSIWTALLAVPFVAMSLALFAPVSGSLERGLKWVAIVFWLIYIVAYAWQDWRERRADRSGGGAISSGDRT